MSKPAHSLPPLGYTIGLDGVPRPLTVEKQWGLAESYLHWLGTEAAGGMASIKDLMRAWAAIPLQDDVIAMDDGAEIRIPFERGAALQRHGESPLAAIFALVEEGIYPPPELLLVALDAWRCYISGAGKVDLERAFNGRPVQRLGNLAARRKKSESVAALKWQMYREVRSKSGRGGNASLAQAAEKCAENPESFLRDLRRRGDTAILKQLQHRSKRRTPTVG